MHAVRTGRVHIAAAQREEGEAVKAVTHRGPIHYTVS